MLPWYLGGGATRYYGGRGLVAGGLPIGFLGLWCCIVAGAGGGFYRLMVGYLDMWQRRGRWIGVVLVVQLLE
jgi:hypothetical protein